MYAHGKGYRRFPIISMTNATSCVGEVRPVHFSYMTRSEIVKQMKDRILNVTYVSLALKFTAVLVAPAPLPLSR